MVFRRAGDPHGHEVRLRTVRWKRGSYDHLATLVRVIRYPLRPRSNALENQFRTEIMT